MSTGNGEGPVLHVEDIGTFGISSHAHRQFSNVLGIPKKYYDRCLQDSPYLLSQQVNHWLTNEARRRMVRVLDGNVRAILTDRYRRMDYLELCEATLPVLMGLDAQCISSHISETKMHLKFTVPNVSAKIKSKRASAAVGDVVQMGVSFGNSEVGFGRLWMDELDYWLACLNGMIAQKVFQRTHLGAVIPEDGDISEFFTDETKRADDKALWLKVRDAMVGALSEDRFHARVEMYQRSTEDSIPNPLLTVEILSDQFDLSEVESGGILSRFVSGGDSSRFGLAQAIAASSQRDDISYERATDLEALGGTVMALPRDQWESIAVAEVLA
jgi:hypothetical protein